MRPSIHAVGAMIGRTESALGAEFLGRAGRFGDARLPEVVISLRKLRYRAGSAGLSHGLLRAPQKPHKPATRWPVPTGIPRTERHTPVHLLCVLKAQKIASHQRRCA
jgi:hypothetical protein